jgi:hypothetical protein
MIGNSLKMAVRKLGQELRKYLYLSKKMNVHLPPILPENSKRLRNIMFSFVVFEYWRVEKDQNLNGSK